MGKLSGKVAVVAGASKGIGAAIAKRLAAEGAPRLDSETWVLNKKLIDRSTNHL
jgi:3-oxoacyl-ACP reductase-like protein